LVFLFSWDKRVLVKQLAKVLAKELFDSEDALVQLT
jgi:hypothetical protein